MNENFSITDKVTIKRIKKDIKKLLALNNDIKLNNIYIYTEPINEKDQK